MMRKVMMAIVSFFFSGPLFAQNINIAALGDSLTQGYGLEQGQGFVPQLEHWLRTQGHSVSLINAGVSGDTTAGGLSRVAWTLTPDIDAMIVTLGGNDVLRGIDPASSRENIKGILQIAQDKQVPVLLIGMQAPSNYGTDYKEQFDSLYPELAAEFDTLYLNSFFAGFGDDMNDPAALRPLMQSDGIHPNANGVTRLVAAIAPKVVELIHRVAMLKTQ